MRKIFAILVLFLVSSFTFVLAEDMRFIQVDNLLYSPKNENSKKMFAKMIDDINKQKNVEFIVFSGNNIAKPDREILTSFLKEAKRLNSPYYVILGNKDVNKAKDLSKKDYMKIVSKKNRTHKRISEPNYVLIKKGLVFIVVDGSKDLIPTSMGYYRTETLDWLEEQLNKYADKKVVILQHFPLVPPAKKESRYTFKADEYIELLKNHNNVLAVISGHFGVDKETEMDNILHISTAAAPKYKIIDILDYKSEKPTFWTIDRQ